MEEDPIYATQIYKVKKGDILVDHTSTSKAVKGKKN